MRKNWEETRILNHYIKDAAFWNLALPVWYVFSVSEKICSRCSAQEIEVGCSCKVQYLSFMLHGVICRKTAIFIVHAVRTSKLRQQTTPDYGNTRQRTAKHSRLQLLVSPKAKPAGYFCMNVRVIHCVAMRNTPAFAERYRKHYPELWGKSPLVCMMIMLQYRTMLRLSADTMDISFKKPESWHRAWDRRSAFKTLCFWRKTVERKRRSRLNKEKNSGTAWKYRQEEIITKQFLQHCTNKGLWPERVKQKSRAAGRRGD